MKIMVFLHGTSIMHKTAEGVSRQERVRQSKERESAVLDYENYVPVGNSVEKLKNWESQGAGIVYLSSHVSEDDVEKDQIVLRKYNFPTGEIFWRHSGETYAKVVEKVLPDVLIEDDCESIGGKPEMTYPHLNPDAKRSVKSVVVKEFEGIDNLSNDLKELAAK